MQTPEHGCSCRTSATRALDQLGVGLTYTNNHPETAALFQACRNAVRIVYGGRDRQRRSAGGDVFRESAESCIHQSDVTAWRIDLYDHVCGSSAKGGRMVVSQPLRRRDGHGGLCRLGMHEDGG
jgi:hypothetical protein